MTTNPGLLVRTFDWFLDRDGDLYGDEQERLRWYEAIAVVASIQWIVIPWLAVAALALWRRPAAPAVILLMLGLYLPIALVHVYARRWRVRTIPDRWSAKRVVIAAATALPYAVLVIQLLVLYEASSATLTGALTGAVTGVVAVLAATRLTRRRQATRDLVAVDDE